MPNPPYAGPETRTSLNVLKELCLGLPEPVMLLGGWGVYFLVQSSWRQTFNEEYFGSRDIDLGFHTPPNANLADLQKGTLPATIEYLESQGFHRQGMYQVVRFHHWDTHEILEPGRARSLPQHEYYAIAVDLIASHDRPDLRSVAGFQPFSEPLLEHAFRDPSHRTLVDLDGHRVFVPAPHLLVATKLRSLPHRQKDDKVLKDLCDLYALVSGSGVGLRTLRARVHGILPEAAELVPKARDSPFVAQAAQYLEQSPEVIRGALRQLL